MATYDRALFWFRRDLRDEDNAGLAHALKSARAVHCCFVFDREILEPLPARADRRVEFIRESLVELERALARAGGGLIVRHAYAREAIPELAGRLGAQAVFANGDYEPQARDRDEAVRAALGAAGVRLHLAKDQAIFEKDEVLTQAGKPFTVFTPYRRAWEAKLEPFYLEAYPRPARGGALERSKLDGAVPELGEIGFERTNLADLGLGTGMSGAAERLADFGSRIADYDRSRDFPAEAGTSFLGVHQRFGTLSVRAAARMARERRGKGAATWLSEIAWRDFFFQVLWHHPRVASEAFHARYADLEWPGEEAHFDAWRAGLTGYPLVDAGMRQLRATGYMHNRVRMATASFLVKDLLIDWRRGERHFADLLNDFDLAANNGNWQWAASTGCDAAPYFRIFNPVSQSRKFDPGGHYIRHYVPELARVPDRHLHEPWKMPGDDQREAGCVIGRDYPAPIVDHGGQRERALALYKGVR